MSTLEDIKARLAAATPGPWEVYETRQVADWMPYYGVSIAGRKYNRITPADVDWEGYGHGSRKPDAVFIANAPTDIARLIAALEAVSTLFDGVHLDHAEGVTEHVGGTIRATIARHLEQS